MATKFSPKTFQYFDAAKRHRKNKVWFEKNRPLYDEHVREPFFTLATAIKEAIGKDLPRIRIEPKKISQPIYRANRIPEDGSRVKTQASLTFGEKENSRFEWNPRIHFSLGAEDDDNMMAIGLYMVSGRQIHLLREAIANSSDARAALENRRMIARWGKLAGEKYKRFPKGFDENNSAAKYLWNKQFYFANEFRRKEVCANGFNKKMVDDLRAALPFYSWLRSAVGTYSRGVYADSLE